MSDPTPPPLNVAIIGAGPAGLYAAGELLRRHPSCRIELLEQLDQCGGLVRYGVAPDHPKTRRVMKGFERTLADARVTVRTGHRVATAEDLNQLRARVDAVLLATGAPSDRLPNLPGIELPQVWGSVAFTGWYNGHPSVKQRRPDLSHSRAVVIGNGNVALDVARLLTRPIETLENTDICPSALAELSRSAITEVCLIGRRGPAQASFRPPELKELLGLDHLDCLIEVDDLTLTAEEAAWLEEKEQRMQRQVVELLQEAAGRTRRPGHPAIRFMFLTSPSRVAAGYLDLVRNRLDGPPEKRTAHPNGPPESVECGLIITCTGQRSPRFPGLPYDASEGIIPNTEGRVEGEPGVYVTGWVKRGASGLIGTNKRDAQETVQHILQDALGH